MRVRQPVVAGRFYDADPVHLWSTVDDYLSHAKVTDTSNVRAVIAPHAGYVYSGPVAGSAFAVLQGQASRIRRVILLGTCHTAGVIGAVASGADAFETPIGLVPVDRDATTEALRVTGVYQDDEAHRIDHALEVELPFLQRTLGRFSIVPLLVGRQAVEAVTGVLDLLVDQESLIVVSTDLSHYQNYEAAQALDRSTAAAIEKLAPENLDPSQACGFDALRGLLEFARNQHWRARVLDLRSSGDTAGPRDRVVGYVAAVLYESNGSA